MNGLIDPGAAAITDMAAAVHLRDERPPGIHGRIAAAVDDDFRIGGLQPGKIGIARSGKLRIEFLDAPVDAEAARAVARRAAGPRSKK